MRGRDTNVVFEELPSTVDLIKDEPKSGKP
jgi:hypothetical protein